MIEIEIAEDDVLFVMSATSLPGITLLNIGNETLGLTYDQAQALARALITTSEEGLDTESSNSRQHYIDTGRYLTHDEQKGRA